jgi:glycosyltransferase involved in cell wall biosynthesis
MPTVSIIIPTHNRAKLVQEALRSVLGQTFQDYEVIIVDDGSSDNTRQVIKEFTQHDKRMHYFCQSNRGPSAARNRGIRASKGQYIAFLDDDDMWLPEKLEKQMRLILADDNVSVAHCDFRFVDEHGNLTPMRWRRAPRRGTLYEDLMYDNVIAGSASAVLVRRQVLMDVGSFDEHLQACEDQDLWRRIALAHGFGYLDEVLVHVRWHAGNIQKNGELMATSKERYLKKLRAELPQHLQYRLSDVAYHTYASIALFYVHQNRYDLAMPFIVRIARLGPLYLFTFLGYVALRLLRILFFGKRKVGIIRSFRSIIARRRMPRLGGPQLW